jgi:Na+/H+ antiporter NhaD/arsenite permease-like protein
MIRPLGVIAALVLLPFFLFSAWLVADTGYLELFRVAARDRWALQMLLDVAIACLIFTTWMVPDAQRHGINPWPYVAITAFLGSIGGLAYLVHRGLLRRTPV